MNNPNRILIVLGGSHRLLSKQVTALKQAGIEFKEVGAASLGSKKRHYIIDDTPQNRILMKEIGGNIARKQWKWLKENPDSIKLKKEKIKMRRPRTWSKYPATMPGGKPFFWIKKTFKGGVWIRFNRYSRLYELETETKYLRIFKTLPKSLKARTIK